MILAEGAEARHIDETAMAEWHLSSSVLVEAAGRECAQVLINVWPHIAPPGSGSPSLILAAGSGNNAADGMVLLKTLILKGFCNPSRCWVVLSKPEISTSVHAQELSPRIQALRFLQKLGIPCIVWHEISETERKSLFENADLIIDALTGTGLSGAVQDTVAELVAVINRSRKHNNSQRVVSIGVPSGLSDSWDLDDPVVEADLCLAIEPVKACLFKPAARTKAGFICPVTGIFPPALLEQCGHHRLIGLSDFTDNPAMMKAFTVSHDAYKHQRGVVHIYAGSPGTSGAALLCGRGAQAGGAGLVQIITEQVLAEHLMGQAGGMLLTCTSWIDEQRSFRKPPQPDAIIMGPGLMWKQELDDSLQKAVQDQVQNDIGLVFDAGAVEPAAAYTFPGPTVFTPHPVEFERFFEVLIKKNPELAQSAEKGLPRMIKTNPVPLLQIAAEKTKSVIILKGHVIHIVAPDGAHSVVDGMESILAMGGSGDVLAGLLGALMARMKRNRGSIDPIACSELAVNLLVEAGHRLRNQRRFSDPTCLADILGELSGELLLQPLGGAH